MLRRTCLLMLLSALAPGFARGQAETLAVDPAHTSVVFSVSHLGFSFCYGIFKTVAGEVVLDQQNPAASKFTFTVDVASIDTAQPKRDQHLLSADFFDAQQFPQITFVSKAVEPGQDDQGRTLYKVTGDMTMHGVTREVVLPVVLLGVGKNPMSSATTAGFLCQTTLKRSDFGMGLNVGPIGDAVGITVSFEATPPAPPAQ